MQKAKKLSILPGNLAQHGLLFIELLIRHWRLEHYNRLQICNNVIIHFPPDSQQPFFGFQSIIRWKYTFWCKLPAVETLQKPVGCQGV